MGIRMFLRGLLLSDEQRLRDQIRSEVPFALERFRYLVSTAGPDAAPGIWLRDLALRASSIRAARGHFLLGRESFAGSRHESTESDGSSLWALAKADEPNWWADRAVYLTYKEEEQIIGGPPTIPGLWDEEMSEFISLYPPLDLKDNDE